MKRYKYTKLRNLGPVHGFLIHTPDDRKLKDTHPQTIVRELNRLNDEMEEKRKDIVYLATEKAKLEDRIKRLEEALEGTVKWIVDLANSGDAGFWNPDEQSVIIAARAALKKEDK